MKVAYLTSRYPAVSHTFILREVQALRSAGLEIGTFSVRRATAADCLDDEARAEAKQTRALVPPPWAALLSACLWALTTRSRQTFAALRFALAARQERRKWIAYFGEAVLLARWLVDGGYDHLHVHFGNSGSSTGILAAMMAEVPYSVTCHRTELLEPIRYRLPEKLRYARFFVCISKYGRAQLMHVTEPHDWPKIHLVRCGLIDPAAGRMEPGDPQHLLCVARLAEEKAHFVLLEALRMLREDGVPFRCTLVGDGPLRSAIETRIGALDLAESVTLAGAQPPEAVETLYREAGVVVLASFSEGVPVVLMEALSHHRPVVATQVGGIPELVVHGVRGLLVPPGSPRELADALACVIRDPESARKLGEAGAAFVIREFNLEVSARRLLALFDPNCPDPQGVTSSTLHQDGASCPPPAMPRNC